MAADQFFDLVVADLAGAEGGDRDRGRLGDGKISGGTRSEAGRDARDALLGLMKTCQKLGASFFGYLGHRLDVKGATIVPSLPDLVIAAKA
jgi:hypothetical protein